MRLSKETTALIACVFPLVYGVDGAGMNCP